MKYKVSNINNKTTKDGKAYLSVTLTDPNGVNFEKVSIWSDNDAFEAIMAGVGEIEGTTVQKGAYTNFKGSRSPVASTPPPARPNFAPVGDVISKRVSEAQSRKEDGIKTSSIFRDATLMVSTMYPELRDDDVMTTVEKTTQLRSLWLNWRKWFDEKYDGNQADDVPF